MAKTKDNIFMFGHSGTIGRQMTLSLKAGDTIIGKKRGSSSIPSTPEQLEIQDRFKLSSIYAQAAIRVPETKAAYAAKAKIGQSAFNVAFADAFTPPEIKSINRAGYSGHVGDTIVIRAVDYFKVVAVHVKISNVAGVVLEEGNAILQANGLDWKYTATTVINSLFGCKITATAIDLPANETVQVLQLVA